MERNRNQYVDVLRGIAICLVILGHTQQMLCKGDFWGNPLFKGIYMCHMPLFIFISGIFFKDSLFKGDFHSYFKKQNIRLLLPNTSWWMIFSILTLGADWIQQKEFDATFFLSSYTIILWFLPVLYFINVIMGFFTYYNSKKKFIKYSGIAYLFIYLCIVLMPDINVIPYLKFLFPFFVLGMFFKKIKSFLFNNQWLSIILITLYLSLGIIWKSDFYVYNTGFNLFSIHDIIINSVRFVAGITGICLFMYITHLVSRLPHAAKILSALGMMTLPLYTIQQLIFRLLTKCSNLGGNYPMTLIIATFVVLISIGVYKILRKIPYMNTFLFGESYK